MAPIESPGRDGRAPLLSRTYRLLTCRSPPPSAAFGRLPPLTAAIRRSPPPSAAIPAARNARRHMASGIAPAWPRVGVAWARLSRPHRRPRRPSRAPCVSGLEPSTSATEATAPRPRPTWTAAPYARRWLATVGALSNRAAPTWTAAPRAPLGPLGAHLSTISEQAGGQTTPGTAARPSGAVVLDRRHGGASLRRGGRTGGACTDEGPKHRFEPP